MISPLCIVVHCSCIVDMQDSKTIVWTKGLLIYVDHCVVHSTRAASLAWTYPWCQLCKNIIDGLKMYIADCLFLVVQVTDVFNKISWVASWDDWITILGFVHTIFKQRTSSQRLGLCQNACLWGLFSTLSLRYKHAWTNTGLCELKQYKWSLQPHMSIFDR